MQGMECICDGVNGKGTSVIDEPQLTRKSQSEHHQSAEGWQSLDQRILNGLTPVSTCQAFSGVPRGLCYERLMR